MWTSKLKKNTILIMWRIYQICKYLDKYQRLHAETYYLGVGHSGVNGKEFKEYVLEQENKKLIHRIFTKDLKYNVERDIKKCFGEYIKPTDVNPYLIRLTPKGEDMVHFIHFINYTLEKFGPLISFFLGIGGLLFVQQLVARIPQLGSFLKGIF